LILTTNLPFGEWTKVFEDARLAKAVIDRLTHNATSSTPARSPGVFITGWERAWKTGGQRLNSGTPGGP